MKQCTYGSICFFFSAAKSQLFSSKSSARIFQVTVFHQLALQCVLLSERLVTMQISHFCLFPRLNSTANKGAGRQNILRAACCLCNPAFYLVYFAAYFLYGHFLSSCQDKCLLTSFFFTQLVCIVRESLLYFAAYFLYGHFPSLC